MNPKRHILSSALMMLTLFSFGGCVTDEAPDSIGPRQLWDGWLDQDTDWDTLEVAGMVRTFKIHFPPVYTSSDESLPVVIGLHGTGGSGRQFERHYHFSDKADQAGFIAVYPNGVVSDGRFGIRTWNAGACCDFSIREDIDDIAFISRLIDELLAEYRVDPKRVYVTGMSNGGMLAYRLAAEIPEKIAAIAPVSCTMVFDPPAKQPRPVPILHLHSVLDNIVPYAGGPNPLGHHFPSVDSVLHVWAGRNGCQPQSITVAETGLYKQVHWVDQTGTPLIVHYVTQDGGHSWPGGQRVRPKAAPPSTAIDANDLIWDFFGELHL